MVGRLIDLLPPYVRVGERCTPGDPTDLLGCERDVVADAVTSRRAEFAAGRSCARRALDALGLPPEAIGVAADRSPLWPAGVRGSITHCAGYAAAALARTADVSGIGIDAEPAGPLDDEVVDLVLDPRERAAAHASGGHTALIIFSAKESVFKAHHSAGGGWLDPADVHIEVDAGGTYTAVASAAASAFPRRELTGRWSCGDLVLTALVVSTGRRTGPVGNLVDGGGPPEDVGCSRS